MHATFQKREAFNRNISKRPTCSKLSSFLLQMECLNISRLEFYGSISWQKQEVWCLSGITAAENTLWAHHVDILPHLPCALHPHHHREDTAMDFIPLQSSEVSCFEDRYIHWLEMFPGGRGSCSGTFRQVVRSSHGLRKHGVFSCSEHNLKVIQDLTNPGQRYTV